MHSSKNYKFPLFFLGFYLTFLLLTVCLANRLTLVSSFLEPGGIYVFSLTFIICDVVGEVYGYAYPRLFIWIGAICELLFAAIATIISHFPYPDYFTNAQAYQAVFDPTIRFVFSSITGTIIGEMLNVYLLSKWKIRLQGRFFIMRTLCATALGQAVLTIIVDLLAYTGNIQSLHLFYMMCWGFLWKMGYTIILALPAWVLVKYLKKSEHTDHYDISTNFNPFKLALASDSNEAIIAPNQSEPSLQQ